MSPTAKDLATIHVLCAQLINKDEPSIVRPHNLKLIAKQLTQMSHEVVTKQAAHASYMIMQLKPFEKGNLAAAFVTGLLVRGSSKKQLSEKEAESFLAALRYGESVATLNSILQ